MKGFSTRAVHGSPPAESRREQHGDLRPIEDFVDLRDDIAQALS